MKNEKFSCLIILVFFIFILFSPALVFAQSSYVLPYPSSMPGSLAYKYHLVYEAISKYWYFGDFGQFNYNLKLSDKYLVEAKTLLEYKQYLLGYEALEKSDSYFAKIRSNLLKAEKKNKNVVDKMLVLKEASKKHVEVLKKTDLDTPDIFIWRPEKSAPITLHLKKTMSDSILLREKNL